jgi:hypothetical protein
MKSYPVRALYTVSWPEGHTQKSETFRTKAEALKAVHALKGVRIRPSKMHRGIVYYMAPIGRIGLVTRTERDE